MTTSIASLARRELPPLVLLASVCLLMVCIVAQWPFSYTVHVGDERGPGSDRPYLNGLFFFPPEGSNATGKFRWSRQRPGAIIEMPSIVDCPSCSPTIST